MSCCLLTVISAALFTYLYETTGDPSRVVLLGLHFALAYMFSFISLFAQMSLPVRRSERRKYVQDPDADRQISMIMRMYGRGASSLGIASSLNGSQERYLLDGSEWTKEKIEVVIKAFIDKPESPG
ncbi:hypothetical protein D9M69_624490 [compost metagenome]